MPEKQKQGGALSGVHFANNCLQEAPSLDVNGSGQISFFKEWILDYLFLTQRTDKGISIIIVGRPVWTIKPSESGTAKSPGKQYI